jgi:SSS family solute:Na+ symporter
MFTAPFIIFAKSGFYTYLQQLGGMFCVPVFTIVLLGFISKKVPPQAAKGGILFFITSYVLINYVLALDIHYLHMLALLFLLTTGFMFAVGIFYPHYYYIEIKQETLNLAPWKSRHIYYILLLTGMVTVFILFSKYGIAN